MKPHKISAFSQLFFRVSKGGPKKKCWKTIHWFLAIFQHFSFGVVIGICNYTKNRKRKSKSTFSRIFQVHGRWKQLGFSSGSICFRTRFLPLLPSLQHLLQGHRTLGYAFINNRFLRERGMASKPKMEYQVFLCIFQKNSTMSTLSLKEIEKFLWEGREKGLPC